MIVHTRSVPSIADQDAFAEKYGAAIITDPLDARRVLDFLAIVIVVGC